MTTSLLSRLRHLVFDLDDTLLDTYRQLVPKASREACAAMIGAGLKADLQDCVLACEERGRSKPRQDLFETLISRFGIQEGAEAASVARAGHDAFYNRNVEPDISLFEGVREMLESLRSRYGLHLVTSGNRRTQETKIKILALDPLFDSLHIVDPSKGERKREAFERVMQLTASSGAKPEEHLSIGNRIDTDITEARVLGWRACWVKYGEYVSMKPTTDIERPDFEIDRIQELVEACRL